MSLFGKKSTKVYHSLYRSIEQLQVALWTFMFIMLGFNNFTPSLFNLLISYISISNPSLSYDYKCCSSKKMNKYSFFLSFCLLWKGRSKRKQKRFDTEAYYRNKTKTFWFGLLIIGTKAERYNLFQNYLKSIGTFWRFLKFKNETRTKLS